MSFLAFYPEDPKALFFLGTCYFQIIVLLFMWVSGPFILLRNCIPLYSYASVSVSGYLLVGIWRVYSF